MKLREVRLQKYRRKVSLGLLHRIDRSRDFQTKTDTYFILYRSLFDLRYRKSVKNVITIGSIYTKTVLDLPSRVPSLETVLYFMFIKDVLLLRQCTKLLVVLSLHYRGVINPKVENFKNRNFLKISRIERDGNNPKG